MSINKFNHEHYYDPTPFEALTNIERSERTVVFRPIVYICSPYAGNEKANTEKARRYCRFAVDSGCIPIAPHLFFPQFMPDEKKERKLAMFMGSVLQSKCAELWIFGSTVTKGMRIELLKARSKGQKIRFFDEDCKEVLRNENCHREQSL